MFNYPAYLRKEADLAESEGMPDTAKTIRDAADELERLREWERCLLLASAEVCGHDVGDKSLEHLREGLSSEPADHCFAISGMVEQLRAIAAAVGDLDGEVVFDYAGKLREAKVKRDKFNALCEAWLEWKAAETGGKS